ncbi:DMT family transporter [Weissella cibaria]|uniref:DMT family transporter n=1 Tax=Weissella cibaria TaxID=137591 RepID=UPI001193A02C|nr:multidrug efflux SMR transporter [Weissella cibaria]TVV31964.1 multidrug efflux SMR transporter [Weissella cibaria]
MSWLIIVFAGLFETGGVVMMNEWNRRRHWLAIVGVLISFGISLSLLSFGIRDIPLGTAYAVWTGIGTVGGTVVGMLFYGESRNWKRILFIALILAAAVGLKLTE